MEALEDKLLLPGREARPSIEHLYTALAAAQGHLGTRRGVVQRVLDQHIQGAIEISLSAPGTRPTAAERCQLDSASLRDGIPAACRPEHGIGEVDGFALELAVLRAAQHEQLIDDRRETVDLCGTRTQLGRDRRRYTNSHGLL